METLGRGSHERADLSCRLRILGFLLVVLGTAVRLLFGLRFQGWLGAPDTLAWGLVLEEAIAHPIRYDQLVHWPHEGATPLLSLVAMMFRPAAGALPSLSIAALVVDTLSRGIQVFVAWKVFGRTTALYFAAWTVAAVPGLLPWATVNFGLHALSSFWPFLLLYVAAEDRPSAVRLGILTGLAISWSYDSLVLVPACLVFLFSKYPNFRPLIAFVGTAVLTLSPHIALRVFADPGFALQADPWLSVRGVPFGIPPAHEIVLRCFDTLRWTIPGASLLPSWRWLWSILLYAGLLFAFRDRTTRMGVLVAGSFIIFYSASPFFEPSADSNNYVDYRHVAYILPLLALLVVHASVSGNKWKRALAVGLIALGCRGGFEAWRAATPPATPAYQGAGWVLARKLGHDPPRLARLLESAPTEARADLAIGYGWGLAAVLLAEGPGLERLIDLVERFPRNVRPMVSEGMEHAFQPSVTPVLDRSLLPALREALLAVEPQDR